VTVQPNTRRIRAAPCRGGASIRSRSLQRAAPLTTRAAIPRQRAKGDLDQIEAFKGIDVDNGQNLSLSPRADFVLVSPSEPGPDPGEFMSMAGFRGSIHTRDSAFLRQPSPIDLFRPKRGSCQSYADRR